MVVLSINDFAAAASTPTLFIVLSGIIALVVTCALVVVRQAEHLARQLGEPYGTFILTLSIVLIEAILICAVMLGPGEHPTIARDSVMAVSMIILNLVIGLALLIGTRNRSHLRPNRTGVGNYLAVLVVLLAAAFAVPALIGESGAYSTAQALAVLSATIVFYAYFLFLQMGQRRTDFQEVTAPRARQTVPNAEVSTALKVRGVVLNKKQGTLLRAALLIGAALPIVAASHVMAALLDEGSARTGAPMALSGLLIAVIVFLPETLTAWRAAAAGEIQRVSNLCHGALVSTVGLTIPAVLAIGLLTGKPVVLAESPVNLVLLAATLMTTFASFLGGKSTAMHGGAHLMLFGLCVLTVFA